MEEYIKNIVELDIDLDDIKLEDMGVDTISFVSDAAIEVDFMAFAKQEFVEPNAGESEDDFIGRCIPILINEGMDQDQAVAVCYTYWEGAAVTDGLTPYVDQDECICENEGECTCKKETFSEEQQIILDWARENGEIITEDYTYIKDNQEFSTVTDVTKAIQGLDILSRLGISSGEPAERKYRYTGPTAERGFCKAMLSLNKMYSDDDMEKLKSRLSVINPGMGPRGRNSYSVFEYKGGVNCRHFWTALSVWRPEGSRQVLVIENGPANGNAGKSNNVMSPSPAGSVANNAHYGFSIMDNEKRIVAGPLMIPNLMILRRDEEGQPYYVYFTADTVKRIQERFNQEQKQNNTDLQHDGKILKDNVLIEQWLIEHPTYDKSHYYGFKTLPMYTWFGVYKVNDDDTWARVKSGELRGFSCAGNFIERAKPVNKDEETLSKIIDILNKIR